MSIDVLITGKLFKAAEQRTSNSGNKFTIGRIRSHDGENDVMCSIIAFSESAQNALLALSDGESVSVAGTAKLKTWTNKAGETKPQLDITVAQVLSVYHIRKKRDKTQGEQEDSTQNDAVADRRTTTAKQASNPNDDLDIPF